MKTILLTALFAVTASFASAQCSNEWSIEPTIEHNEWDGVTTALNFVFTFGGSAKAECEAERTAMRNQEIENEYARLELCLLAEEAGSPRLLAECRAEGLLK